MRVFSLVIAACIVSPVVTPAFAEPGKVTLTSEAPFAKVAAALVTSIGDHNMGLVCRANAQQGAAARGVKIAGNQVFMVFRNDFAVRLLAVVPAAGFETPIRIYLYENQDGTATLAYVKPSALLRAYPHPTVAQVAAELDPIFEQIVTQALAAR